ncbi:MAG: hypothetical protein ACNA8W_03090 [Bradymonadaceae bacterium]
MKDSLRIKIAGAVLLPMLLFGFALSAEPPPEPEPVSPEDPSEVEEPARELAEKVVEQARETSSSTPLPDFPSDPRQRVEMAEQAFHHADFDMLRPLLEPILETPEHISDREVQLRAHQLLGVGLFFEAQQVADASRRRELLRQARARFLDLLREEPDHSLDPMIFPASVVELFEEVRQENAPELAAIISARQQDPRTQNPDMHTLYIEREVRANHLILNFFPLGIGQFQNHSPIKGTLFAVTQVAALTVNVLSYYMIERLRGPSGRFDTGPDNRGGDYALALGWQRAQFGALAVLGGFYGWSVLDGVLNFEPFTVHIRTLDNPPPELSPGASSQPGGHGLGWSVKMRW